MTKQLGLMEVNSTFKMSDCSELLQEFILDVGKRLNTYKYETAWINGSLTRDLWNKNTVLGLRIVRDYYLQLELVYPAHDKDGEGPDGYTFWELGRFNMYGHRCELDRVESTFAFSDFIQERKDDVLNKLKDELTQLLGDNYKVVEDYDAEAIEEALECGDLDLLEDLVGDRDLTEFV